MALQGQHIRVCCQQLCSIAPASTTTTSFACRLHVAAPVAPDAAAPPAAIQLIAHDHSCSWSTGSISMSQRAAPSPPASSLHPPMLLQALLVCANLLFARDHLGFLSTMMTESPRRNILLMNLSLLTGREPFLPLPVLGICRHGHVGLEKQSLAQVRAAERRHRKHRSSSASNERLPGPGGSVVAYLCPHLLDVF